MKRTLLSVALLAALAGGGFVVSSHLIGGVVADEVKAFESSLATLDSVQVHKLAYERRLFEGRVDYDLLVRPSIADPAYAELREALGDLLDEGVRLTGSLNVRHGPWLGDGFGLARAEGGLALPDAWRKTLPNYPGQRLLVNVLANMNLSREVALQFNGTDYRGKMIPEGGGAPVDLVFSGLKGLADLSSDLSWIRYSTELDELSLHTAADPDEHGTLKGVSFSGDLNKQAGQWHGWVEGGLEQFSLRSRQDAVEMVLAAVRLRAELGARVADDGHLRQTLKGSVTLDGLTVGADDGKLVIGSIQSSGDAIRHWPNIWLGGAQLTVDSVLFEADEVALDLGKLSLTSSAVNNAGAVDQEVGIELASAALNHIPMGKLRLRLEANGFDGAALDALVPVLEQLGYDENAIQRPEVLDALRAGAQRILSAQPSLAVDPLALSFGTQDELALSVRLSFNGDDSVDIDNIFGLIERLQLDAGVSISKTALREVARISVEVEANEAGQTLTATQREVEQTLRLEQMLSELSVQPMLRDDGEHFVSTASFANGVLLINGEAMPDMNWLEMLGMLGGLFDGEPAPSMPAAAPEELDPNAEALFGELRLRAGFEPDPQEVSVGAGGSTLLTGELGVDCIGHVNASQPDVAFEYQAGSMPLYVYAEADDDITLVVRMPDGSWQCNDDAPGRGLDPALSFAAPQSGRYALWVGTLAADTTGASVYISEVAP